MNTLYKFEMVNYIIEKIDRMFVVVFARYRRKMGDAEINTAWRRANNKVSGFIGLHIAAITILITLVVYSFKNTGERIDKNGLIAAQIIGGVSAIVVATLLESRFKKYITVLPALSSDESLEDKRFVFRLQVAGVGIFTCVCLIAFLWHKWA